MTTHNGSKKALVLTVGTCYGKIDICMVHGRITTVGTSLCTNCDDRSTEPLTTNHKI